MAFLVRRDVLNDLGDPPSGAIVVAGDFLFDNDLLADVVADGRYRIVHRYHGPGGAGLVVRLLRRAGARVHARGVVGRDAAGVWVRRSLSVSGPGCEDHLAVVPGLKTPIKTRVFQMPCGSGSNPRTRLLLRCDEELPPAAVRTLLTGVSTPVVWRPLPDQAAAVCVSDYAKLFVWMPAALAVVLAESERRRLPVVIDPALADGNVPAPAWSLLTPSLRQLLVVKISVEQLARSGLSLSAADGPDLFAAACRRLEDWGLAGSWLVLTHGEHGLWVGPHAGSPHHIRVPFVGDEATGCGDVVTAVLGWHLAAAGRVDGDVVLTAAERAAAVAAVQATRVGCQTSVSVTASC